MDSIQSVPFIGRQQELTALRAAYEATPSALSTPFLDKLPVVAKVVIANESSLT
jgi:hypothetical protein